MALDDTTVIAIIAIVVTISVATSIAVIFAMRRRLQKPQEKSRKEPSGIEPELDLAGMRFKITKSVPSTDASQAKDQLRLLELEREILADAIRRLYEAHAEGKITEPERDRLASNYKQRMNTVKDSIAKDETLVALHELEGMQEDLMKLFSERLGEITSKVDELRTRIDIKPIKEVKIQMPKQQTPIMSDMEPEEENEPKLEDKAKKLQQKIAKTTTERQPQKSQKTEAELRIDAWRAQIDEATKKLNQMEDMES